MPQRREFLVRRSLAAPLAGGATLLLLCLTGLVASEGAAAETGGAGGEVRDLEVQNREFAILIDGTKRGTSKMQIRRRSDGTTWMRGGSEIRINFLVYRYNYESHGVEVWKNGRLVGMSNVSNYDGTQFRVKASLGRNGLQLGVDGTLSNVDRDCWLSSYWQAPDRLALGEHGTHAVTIVDSDQGKILHCNLESAGKEAINAAGGERPCTHYRLTGDVTVDLWYDASGRLVRQASKERGHRVTFELTQITGE